MHVKKSVIALGLICLTLCLVPLLMVINQWITSEQAYGVNTNDRQQLQFSWQDVNQNTHDFPVSAGGYTYLFLGFLSCSEICPIRIQQLNQLEQQIQQDALLTGADVRFMFVTIDPDNDTPKVRKSLIDDRSSRFVSASLFEDDLYQLDRRLSENVNRKLASINHVGKLFLISPKGHISRVYTAKQLSTQHMLLELKHIILSEK